MRVNYRPPKLKPNKKNKIKPLPEWDTSVNDLNKYKLTSTEILKKKINSVSKNLEIAKRTLNENVIKNIENKEELALSDVNKGVMKTKSKSKPKIRPKSIGRMESQSKKEKSEIFSFTNLKHKNLLLESLNNQTEDEIVLEKNHNIKIIPTKTKGNQEGEFLNIAQVKKSNILDDDLNRKLNKLEENLMKYDNKPHKNNTITDNKNNFSTLKLHESSNFDSNQDNQDDENISNIHDDMVRKLDNLSGIEESMKKLNDILDFSNKSSIKFKYEVADEVESNYSPIKKDKTYIVQDSKKGWSDVMPVNKKHIEVQRKIVKIDEQRVPHKVSEVPNENIQSQKECSELDYMRDLLLKTKKELDNFKTKFEPTSKQKTHTKLIEPTGLDIDFMDEEVLPRQPPSFVSGYKLNKYE